MTEEKTLSAIRLTRHHRNVLETCNTICANLAIVDLKKGDIWAKVHVSISLLLEEGKYILCCEVGRQINT